MSTANKLLKLTRIMKDGVRYYQPEGTQTLWPSVTTVIHGVLSKPQLQAWERKNSLDTFKKKIMNLQNLQGDDLKVFAEKELDKMIREATQAPENDRLRAADFGTQSHDIIEQLIKSDNPEAFEVPDKYEKIKTGFLRWHKQAVSAKLEILQTEVEVYSAVHGYAGTLDAIGKMKIDGKDALVVMDWKTSNKLYPEYALQIAAYARAYEELFGQKIDEGLIVKFPKDSTRFEARRVKDLNLAFDAFKSTLLLWNVLHAEENPLL